MLSLRRARPRGRDPRLAAASPRVGAARREIGIRLALGADRRRIVASVLRENSRLIAAGLGIGTPLALVVTAAARGLLFGIEPRDPATVTAAVAALGALALLASAIPAHRAARVDPMSTLKDD